MKFRTIVADPPWTYRNPRAFVGGSWGTHAQVKARGGGTHRYTRRSPVAAGEQYPTLTLEDILALPVSDLSEEDAYLWLWIPNQHLLQGVHLRVLDAWGFTLRGSRVWIKERCAGMGYWFRYTHEHLVLGTRGKPGPLWERQSLGSVLRTPRGRHSEKPEEAFRDIERACPGPYLELFARPLQEAQRDLLQGRQEEWTRWGNEVGDPLGIGFDPKEWRCSRS